VNVFDEMGDAFLDAGLIEQAGIGGGRQAEAGDASACMSEKQRELAPLEAGMAGDEHPAISPDGHWSDVPMSRQARVTGIRLGTAGLV
jgi:hypothetical protein